MLKLVVADSSKTPSSSPKQSEISPLNGEVVYDLRKMLVSTQQRELLQFQTLPKHTLGREIDKRNLKIMNLTYFRPKMRGNVKKTTTQSTSELSPKHQTSEIYLRTSHLMSR